MEVVATEGPAGSVDWNAMRMHRSQWNFRTKTVNARVAFYVDLKK